MIGRPAGMKRVPINPPRGRDPAQHQIVGEVHSWDPPKIITSEAPQNERLEPSMSE
jgi:hypothetical protein